MPLKFFEIGQGALLYQKVDIFDISGPHSHPPVAIEVKFAQPSGPTYPSALSSLTLICATSCTCEAKKPDFWPVSKFNTGSLPFRAILLVT